MGNNEGMTASDRKIALWLFVAALATYWLVAGGHFYASDDLQKVALLEALVYHGTFATDVGWIEGVGGKHFSWFPLGASLLMLPGYLVGRLATELVPMLPPTYVIRFAISLENAVFSALLVSLVFTYARWLGRTVNGSLFAALALGLGTMVMTYAKSSWSEPGATCLVFIGLFALQHAALRGQKWGARWLVLAGCALGGAALVRQELAIVAAGAIGWWIVRAMQHGESAQWQVRALSLCGPPLLAAAALTLWYEQLRYGAYFGFPNYHLPQSQIPWNFDRLASWLPTLYRYTASPNQGVLWYSPAIWLGLWGMRRFSRNQPEATWLALWALGPLALFYVLGWGHSTWAWGLRYTYVFLPFALVPAAGLWDHATRRARGALLAVVGVGLLVQCLGVLHDPNRLYERAIAANPGSTIRLVLDDPTQAPLLLAWEATSYTLMAGEQLLTMPPPSPSALHPPDIDSIAASRNSLPDFWYVLMLLAPVPRAAIALVLVILGTMWAFAVLQLTAALGEANKSQEPLIGAGEK